MIAFPVKKAERNGFPHPVFQLSIFNVVLSAGRHTRFLDVFVLNNMTSLNLNCTVCLVLLCLPFTVYNPMWSK